MSVSDFAIELESMAHLASYDLNSKTLLDLFIKGLDSGHIRTQVLQKMPCTYQTARETAQLHETILRQSTAGAPMFPTAPTVSAAAVTPSSNEINITGDAKFAMMIDKLDQLATKITAIDSQPPPQPMPVPAIMPPPVMVNGVQSLPVAGAPQSYPPATGWAPMSGMPLMPAGLYTMPQQFPAQTQTCKRCAGQRLHYPDGRCSVGAEIVCFKCNKPGHLAIACLSGPQHPNRGPVPQYGPQRNFPQRQQSGPYQRPVQQQHRPPFLYNQQQQQQHEQQPGLTGANTIPLPGLPQGLQQPSTLPPYPSGTPPPFDASGNM